MGAITACRWLIPNSAGKGMPALALRLVYELLMPRMKRWGSVKVSRYACSWQVCVALPQGSVSKSGVPKRGRSAVKAGTIGRPCRAEGCYFHALARNKKLVLNWSGPEEPHACIKLSFR